MKIETSTLFHGRNGVGTTWFRPRPCIVPGGTPEAPHLFMTLQETTGSDFFGPVHATRSPDGGRSWSTPEPVAPLARVPVDKEIEEGVCDVVPHSDPDSGKLVLMGHTVRYRRGSDQFDGAINLPRITWTAGTPEDGWAERSVLPWPGPDAAEKWSCGCAQRVLLPEGRMLVPASHVGPGETARRVTTLLCRFDGEAISVEQRGQSLSLPVRRGLLEPSLTACPGGYAMTIRAENDQGFVARCDDGLSWSGMVPWCGGGRAKLGHGGEVTGA